MLFTVNRILYHGRIALKVPLTLSKRCAFLFESEAFMKFAEDNKNVLTVPKYEDCFVYFLLKNSEVVYVGQTQHGLKRPLSHCDKDYDEIKILYCSVEELDFIEDTYIQKYKPIYNKQNNYGMRWGLKRVRDCIRKQTTLSNCTVPKLRKILKSLNIEPQKDYYTGNETISFNEYVNIIEYLRGNEYDE